MGMSGLWPSAQRGPGAWENGMRFEGGEGKSSVHIQITTSSASSPALLLPPFPGIAYSDDKLLQTRIFSYADTQRHRLGPNYLLLPINAPR